VRGEAAGLVLGIDQLPIRFDVEDSVGTLDELWIDAELFFDPGRQTGGLREVVSGDAVGDGHAHGRNSSVTDCSGPLGGCEHAACELLSAGLPRRLRTRSLRAAIRGSCSCEGFFPRGRSLPRATRVRSASLPPVGGSREIGLDAEGALPRDLPAAEDGRVPAPRATRGPGTARRGSRPAPVA
jgi:hypothetical protein